MCVLIVAVFLTAIGLAIFGPAIFSLLRHLRPLQRLRDSSLIRTSDERNRLRLGVASIWANALGLGLIAAVIFVVGASHLGFDIWRHYSGKGASQSTTRLEELLQKKLPDPEVQQRQHQAIVDAIQKWRPPDTVPAPIDNEAIQAELSELESRVASLENAPKDSFSGLQAASTIAWLVVGGLAIVGIGLVLKAFFEKDWPKFFRDVVGALVLLSLSALGRSGLKADLKADLKGDFSVVRQVGNLLSINFGSNTPPPPRLGSRPRPRPTSTPTPAPRDVDVYLHLDVGRGEDAPPALMDCGKAGEHIGPFGIGTKTLDADRSRNLTTIANDIKERAKEKSNRLTAIALIGSADKRSLKPKTASLYSSNAGLARARIGVVREALEGAFKPDKPPPIMEFYAGPEKTDAKLSGDALSSDRSVKICLLWDRKF